MTIFLGLLAVSSDGFNFPQKYAHEFYLLFAWGIFLIQLRFARHLYKRATILKLNQAKSFTRLKKYWC